ncbi:response regulator [Bacillus sp. FJAT-50079]|uniref:response regulator transcription factor n=1 Tax=Bacillus sp. FJAT-50079 TaxID=2833577 RepID=UPI001BC96B6F|nr:response regulator [Bacillus sp. FJAT-50079]MBS4208076.1 response regulator [Bacillus sp. FJAT-50079]
MYKVLIADDEIYVSILIEKLVDWNKLDMKIVGTAENGISALEKVKELQPDIVIVDVRMPGYDGITLMQKVREMNNKVKFIVISGHKKFEYAKSALQYNVEDYMLKPINKKELETILFKIKTKLDGEKENAISLRKMDRQLGVSKSKVRSFLINQFLLKEIDLDNASLTAINKDYFTQLEEGSFTYFIVNLDSSEKQLNKDFNEEMLIKLSTIFYQSTSLVCFDVISHFHTNAIVFLANYSKNNYKALMESIEKAFKDSSMIIAKFEQLFITVGIGSQQSSLSGSYNSYGDAKHCIDSRIALGIGQIITSNQVKIDEKVIEKLVTEQTELKLVEAIKSFNPRNIRPLIYDILLKAGNYHKDHTLIYTTIVYTISRLFYKHIHQFELYKSTYDVFIEEYHFDEILNYCTNTKDIARALTDRIEGFIEKYTKENETELVPAIRIAKSYIMENYQQEISLDIISNIVNLSSVYFSILFKKEVGINFLDYLNRYRIEAAKEMLKDVKYNINDVATLSGFQDSRYFSKKFKKQMGVTPSEYRKRTIKYS